MLLGRKMSKPSGVSYLKAVDGTVSNSTSSAQGLAQRLALVATQEFSLLLQSFFDGIDDSLFELANTARTNNEQNRCFEAMREIRIKRKVIESRFLNKIQTLFSFAHTESPHPSEESSKKKDIELILNDELEEDVAIHAMTAKAQATLQGPLLQFKTRAASVYGAKNINNFTSPLSPHEVCVAFCEACSTLEIDIKERLIVLKQFDRYVMGSYGQVISACNNFIIQAGNTAKSNHNQAEPNTSQHQKANTQKQSSSDAPVTHSNPNKSQELQTLLNNVKKAHLKHAQQTVRNQSNQNSAPATPSRKQPRKTGSKELLSTLDKLQQQHLRTLDSESAIQNIDLHTAIAKELSLTWSTDLQQTDTDLINLVSMLFDYILEEYNLAPAIQELLYLLQVPILKTALNDKSFFGSNQHPARKLLTSLAQSCVGYTDAAAQNQDKLYTQVRHTIRTVLSDFNGNANLLETLNAKFEHFAEKETAQANITESRTQKAEEGRARSRKAQQQVESVLSNKILSSRHPIPAIVIDLLKNGWARVMFLAYLKDEQEHQWRNSIKIAEDLIWCVQPLSEQADKQKWIRIVPKLLKELKSGLEAVSYKTSSLEQLMKDLQDTLTEIYKSDHRPDDSSNEAASTQRRTQPAPNTAPEKTDKHSAPKPDLRELIKPGQWFEFHLNNDEKIRCKLSTHIPEADCYIFVNRMGQKALEKSRKELTEDLQNKKAIILSQGQRIDRAISAVMTNLRLK